VHDRSCTNIMGRSRSRRAFIAFGVPAESGGKASLFCGVFILLRTDALQASNVRGRLPRCSTHLRLVEIRGVEHVQERGRRPRCSTHLFLCLVFSAVRMSACMRGVAFTALQASSRSPLSSGLHAIQWIHSFGVARERPPRFRPDLRTGPLGEAFLLEARKAKNASRDLAGTVGSSRPPDRAQPVSCCRPKRRIPLTRPSRAYPVRRGDV
jgi:hypothetical protein